MRGEYCSELYRSEYRSELGMPSDRYRSELWMHSDLYHSELYMRSVLYYSMISNYGYVDYMLSRTME